MKETWQHFIDGEWVAGKSGEILDSSDPATGAHITKIARGNAADVDRAVASSRAAASEWRAMLPMDRARLITEIGRAIRANTEHLAELEKLETGKPAFQAPLEVESSARYFEFFGGLVHTLEGETLNVGPHLHSYTLREPFGVIGVITPWNAPLTQAARAIAPALAAGNVVVCKPSEFTSASTLELARIAHEAGLPKGVFNVVTGTGPEAGAPIVEHAEVRKVAFTGSLRAGKEIGRVAADRILPLTLELGGKSPNLVFADADMSKAVPGALRGFVANAGQICSAGTRLLVEKSVHDDFVAALVTAAETVKPGQMIGPLTTEAQYEKVQGYFETAKQEGATAAVGGNLPDDPALAGGYFVPPTVYTGVRNDMRIAREEIFGPVASVIPFGDEDEAIAIANDSDYGLAAGLWTRDISRAHRVAARLEAGQVYVNDWIAGSIEQPFGGYKQSGYGREKGIEALHHYTQLKCVTITL
ncbi:MAG: aldehyde dehydrogenase family protein [Myxococcota bacterium]